MSATLKPSYGSKTSITITLNGLTNSSSRSSAAVDNSSNLFVDALVQIKVKTNASGTSGTGTVNIYVYASADGGTSYPDGCGTDTGISSVADLRFLGQVNTVANSTSYISEPMSVASAFGGLLPENWGIAVQNLSGATLDSTAGNFDAFFQPLNLTVG